ncbi:hypothetical protein [Phaeovulum sp.]|uniref:hypothetical protein n=1 Tax=Phaeovulum sp. TaxID=2934796 RepID=UPI003561DF0C
MKIFDMTRDLRVPNAGVWPKHRGALLASAAILLTGTAAAMTLAVVLRSPPVSVAAPAPSQMVLPRPLSISPELPEALVAAVIGLQADPVIRREEPISFVALPPLATSTVVTMSSKSAPEFEAAASATVTIVTALPLPSAEVLAPIAPEAFVVDVAVPGADTPRPALRPDAIAALAAPARPLPRPERVLAAAPTMPQPTPRPQANPVAAASLVAATPAPRPYEQADTVLASAQAPAAAPVVVAAQSAAPASSPMPETRPAKVLLAAAAAVAARQAAGAVAAAPEVVQTVALREPVAPNTGALADALARSPVAADCTSKLSRGIPRRSNNAVGGNEFGTTLANVSGVARDQLIAREVLSGNVPQFLRNLIPVSLSGTAATGKAVTITVCVTPDYVAVGDDDDFLRVPMGLPEAAQIADSLGFMLPTTRIVDAIFAQAALQLTPRPMQAGPQMTSTSYLREHNTTIDNQILSSNLSSGALVAGIKKDLVLTNALRRAPGQVAIYGWHQANGRPIQPLTTVHGQHYSDYSHGVRLVSQTAYLNGRAVALTDLLEDPSYAQILSSEGPIAQSEMLLASLYTR